MTGNDIGFYPDELIQAKLREIRDHDMMQTVLRYTFPDKNREELDAVIDDCHSTYDFQSKVIYPALQRLLHETSGGLSTGGFDRLDKSAAYLYLSNHRDIVLDASLTNYVLLEKGMVMTAYAIGDNLVANDFLLHFSKINRNFLVRRNLSPREMLLSARHLSSFIMNLIQRDRRSVWIAQREGRTKDGNDTTHQGVLKMLSLAKEDRGKGLEFLQRLHIVPLSISYELDPTDHLKVKELLAAANKMPYEKEKGEDFRSILTGLMGQKKRIHLEAGGVLDDEIGAIASSGGPEASGIQELSRLLDRKIQGNYHLWPTNYIAYDHLFQKNEYSHCYSGKERSDFLDRMKHKLNDFRDPKAEELFLRMYANPVINKLNKQEV